MPSGQNPVTPHRDGIRVIAEMQRTNRDAPNGCQSDDPETAIDPLEMLSPCVNTRVEQWYQRTSFWIRCVRLVAFMAIADRASQPEICLVISATAGERDNMLNLQASHNQVLRTQTVSTAIRRCYSNPKLVMKRSRAFRRPYPAKALTPHNNPKRIAICGHAALVQ